VYARISTENCGLPDSSNDGRKFSTTGAQLCLCQPGPKGLVRTWKLDWRLQPIAGA
jgi:hypothetical protein